MAEVDWEEIWSCRSSVAEDLSVVGCDAVCWVSGSPTLWRIVVLLSSGLGLQGTEDVLQNVGNLNYSPGYPLSCPRKLESLWCSRLLLTVVFWCRSFVPPVRDEESETQRKAHAKRVRETRRSTQGVTLEEIKVAEQLVKKKNQQQLHQATQQLGNSEQVHCLILLLRISVCFCHC